MLPLISDLLKLNNFISREIGVFKTLLLHNANETVAWLRLAEATLSRIVLFNKRRGGEMSRMIRGSVFERYRLGKRINRRTGQNFEFHRKKIARKLKLVQIREKRGRTVPVL